MFAVANKKKSGASNSRLWLILCGSLSSCLSEKWRWSSMCVSSILDDLVWPDTTSNNHSKLPATSYILLHCSAAATAINTAATASCCRCCCFATVLPLLPLLMLLPLPATTTGYHFLLIFDGSRLEIRSLFYQSTKSTSFAKKTCSGNEQEMPCFSNR